LSSNLEIIKNIDKKYHLFTIEDCTHGFGGTYNGKPNGTYCDASFFSAQWNKPFSSGVGGFAMINNPNLNENLLELEKDKIPVSFSEKLSLKLLYFIKRYLINDFTYFFMVNFYRWLSKHNIVLGSSSGKEITSVEMPNDFYKDYSVVQAKEALRNLKNLDSVLELRQQNAKKYTEFLSQNGKNHVLADLFENHSFLKYPVLVKNRPQFFRLAEKAHIPIGDWFISPIHPVLQDFTPWYFVPDEFPIAVEMAEKVVNLPTDTKQIAKVIEFLLKNIDYIEPSK
jgi:perosamine synthetase